MSDLQQRLDELRRRVQNLTEDTPPETLAQLERSARALLTDAKNTPYESAAQALFGELARASSPTSTVAATVRGLLRRARIRLEIAGDDDDIDEAIDILAEALALNPQESDTVTMLQDAGRRNPQAGQRVSDLFSRYGVRAAAAPREPTPPPAPPSTDEPSPPAERDRRRTTSLVDPAPSYPTSSGYPAPERDIFYQETPTSSRRPPGQGPLYAGADIDDMMSELTQTYYAGDYQHTVDLANRILSQQPGNPTALEYRQKAEDNLIRGVVPDHRIPFEARVAYNRANSLVRAGNYDEAERLYREARDLAERSGILSWKDAEQALLDIQDLALARELLNEGDRLMAVDNWTDAIRKYEGALRVVPNDPQAEERLDKVRRVQQDADQAAVQLSMLSGSLSDQVSTLQNIQTILARLRQLLPNSQRLAQLSLDANHRLNGIKMQLNDQAQAALNRAGNATSLEERISLTTDALQLLELGVKLDPGDTMLADSLLAARASTSDLQRARQIIERAAMMVAQNLDNELVQARSLLAGLLEHAQDNRYRTVVNDLLTRFIERAAAAVEEGDSGEAEALLAVMREEPFHILGRRGEIARLEQSVRAMRQRGRVRAVGIFFIIILLVGVGVAGTSPMWLPIINPPPTPTPTFTPSDTPTFTPSATFTPSETFTPTYTYTPTFTPSITWTPTWTVTPSLTVTPSWTPTETLTPTHTPTLTLTYTPSDTPTITDTPTVTPTLSVLCQVFVQRLEPVNVRARPTTGAALIGIIQPGTIMDVTSQEVSASDGRLWYRVTATIEGGVVSGYVRGDTVVEVNNACPDLR